MNYDMRKHKKYASLVGYPQIFHTKNSKEFTGSDVADLLKANNPHCHVVTGFTRTPQDQGSIESGNKLVQSILKSIQSEQRKSGLDDKRTLILGQVTACCNDHLSQMSNSVSPLKAVFELECTSPTKISLTNLHHCQTIWDCLKICPNKL
jgi:hypothetical protein